MSPFPIGIDPEESSLGVSQTMSYSLTDWAAPNAETASDKAIRIDHLLRIDCRSSTKRLLTAFFQLRLSVNSDSIIISS